MTPHPPGRAGDEQYADDEVKAVEPRFQGLVLVPLLAELLTDVGQADAPGQRAKKGVDDEACQVHAGNTGREGDERAHNGQQAAGENDDLAILLKPAIREVEI